jgi:prephenate dehydrogenase
LEKRFEQLSIMGVGLIGGAVGMAARKAGVSGRVIGYCRRPEACRLAVECGAVDECFSDPLKAAAGSDLVILAVGPEAAPQLAAAAAAELPPDAVVTDVASVKNRVVAGCVEALGHRARFVGSHPLAGSEQRGCDHAAEVVLNGALCVLTPNRSTDPSALSAVRAFWEELGMRVTELPPEEHDARLARTSHLPHAAAAALAAGIQPGDEPFCAGGFRDTTRVAAGEATLWTEIAMSNREALAAELYRLAKRLQGAADQLTTGDREAFRRFLSSGSERRAEIVRGD